MKTSNIIPLADLETIYRVLLQRIVKGYSARQLSFLIGAETDHVEEVEQLRRPIYSGAELERIAIALESTNVDDFCPEIHNDAEIHISVERVQHKEKLIHTYCRIDEQGEEEELFRLREDRELTDDDLREDDDRLKLVKDIITVMISASYFYEPKLPLEVYKVVNNLLPVPVNPSIIAAAIDRFFEHDLDRYSLRTVGENAEPYMYEQC